jgi:two-component system LytT family sensor kinase
MSGFFSKPYFFYTMHRFNKTKQVRILWCIVSFSILYFYRKSCSLNHQLSSDLIITLIDLVCLICCFYIIRKYLISKFLYRKNQITFFVLLFLEVIIFSNVMLLMQWCWYTGTSTFTSEQSYELLTDYYYQLYDCYIVVLIGCLCAIAFKLMVDLLTSQNRNILLQKINAQTELSFLKAQINPHFLFNSINSIFAHINKNNIEARNMVLKFSDMLRYQLYECNNDKINFEKEFYYLNNFIELQQLRKGENLKVVVETKGEMRGFNIAPLLLLPFVENAFKYASNHDDKNNILKICLSMQADTFYFHCMNTKDKIISKDLAIEKGIGINNVKRRLQLLYSDKHHLQIKENDHFYEVHLKIQLG